MTVADSWSSAAAAEGATSDLLRTDSRRPSPGRAVASGALALLSTQPLTWAASMLSVILVPRYLGDVALGQWTVASTLSVLAGPAVSLGLLEYLSRNFASQAKDAAREAALALVLMTAAACTAATVLGLGAFLAHLQVGGPIVLLTVLGLIVITPTQGLLLTVLRGQERMGRFAAVNSLSAAAASVLPVGVVVVGGGLTGFAVSTLLVNVVALAVSWRTSGVQLPRVQFRVSQLLALLPVGLPFFGWNLTMQFYGQIDRILIGILAPVQVAGWYGAAARIIAIPVFVPMLIVTPLFPALTRCRDNRRLFRDTLNGSLRATLLTTAPFCAATAAAAPAIPRFLGWPDEFEAAIAPMTILAPNLALVAVDMMLGTALLALGLERKWLIVGIMAAILNPSLNLLAIPFAQGTWGNGGIGAASVTVVTELMMLCGALVLLPRGMVDRAFAWTVAGVAISGAAFVAITRELLAIGVALPLAVPAGGAAFVLVIVGMRVVTVAELQQALAVTSRLIGSKLGRTS